MYNVLSTMAEKPQDDHSSLYHRIGRLRWQAAFFALTLVLLHQWVEHAYLFYLPRWTHFWTQVTFYGLIGPLLAWLALTSLRRQIGETEQAERDVRRSRDELAEVNRRLEFLIEVERRLSDTDDKDELLGAFLELPLEVLPGRGVSLIRFDHEGNPLPAHHHGSLSPEEFEAWTAHLAADDTSQACRSCSAKSASAEVPCPLLSETPLGLDAHKVYCLTLTRGERQFGTLNIYLADDEHPTMEEEGLLQVMASSMSLALESQLLRAKELDTLYHLREIHHLQGLEAQLRVVVKSTVQALELNGGAVYLAETDDSASPNLIAAGEDIPSRDFIAAMAAAVKQSKSPLLAGDLDLTPLDQSMARSLVVAPLRKEDDWMGSLLFWSDQSATFPPRQVRIVESVASQAALLVENHRLYRQVEFRAGLAERARLAREIHDGLAQSLGYLKLRMVQVIHWQQEGQSDRVRQSLVEIKDQINEAYIDAREAIDGLRMDPREASFQSWLDAVYQEFEELCHIHVEAADPPELELPPTVKSQLLRIIQEALGNIRKHAAASKAWVDWQNDDHWCVLHVRDNGRGFDPEQIPVISQHGLRIMRERAELLGADFQLVSRPGQGTEIIVRLPLTALDRNQSYG